MKVLIVRTFPNILKLDAYNVQEIGLAKALTLKGIEVGIVFYNGKDPDRTQTYEFVRDGQTYQFPIYWCKGFGFYKNGFMKRVFKLAKEYDVLQVHEYDQIFSWMFYRNKRYASVIYHGPYYHEYAKGYNIKCKVFDKVFFWNGCYDHVVGLGKSVLASQFLEEKGFQHVHTLGVGVDRENFEKKPGEEPVPCRIERDGNRFRMLYVGKIEDRRNVYFLIQVFEALREKIPNLQLVIVGTGEPDYVEAFLERIRPHIESGDILYFEKAPQKELAQMYGCVDLFIFTSNYEIFGMVLLEAMYFGNPVLSTRNGGSVTLIDHGQDGFIMEQFDEKLWIDTIMELYRDPEKRREIGEKAHRKIEEGFLWDALADRFIASYKEAIELRDNK